MSIRDPAQPDLLTWAAPVPVQKFDPTRVRSATIGGKLKRAIAETLRAQAEQGWDREKIADAMAAYLGETVVKATLDSWASEARADRLPSLPRFAALLAATLDPRLLQVLAQECGWAVVERKWLPLIELASLREHEDQVKQRRRVLQAQGRLLGTLP